MIRANIRKLMRASAGFTGLDQMSVRSSRLLQTASAWVVAIPLAAAGFAHLSNPMYFYSSLVQYDLLPTVLARVTASVLPWLELFLASLLLLKFDPRVCFAISAGLFGSYVVAQLLAVGRGLQIDCGCFGAVVQHPIGGVSIGLVAALFMLSLANAVVTSGSR